jgi:ABC-2 type transport system permease protein
VAVYKRAYRAYDGALTSERWRFLVLPRYAFQEIFESRFLTAFLVICCVPFLAEATAVYVSNSAPARMVLNMPGEPSAMAKEFFIGALWIQCTFAFFLTAWIAPVLISPDLVNGALPLYLSRPFSRVEYVLGKASVLVILLSAITWVPQLLLFLMQVDLGPDGWFAANYRIGLAILLGSWIWIAVLTLLGLALSAWIRWRIVATGALFGVFFMGTAFGEMWREVVKNSWGRVVSLSYLIQVVWADLFGAARMGMFGRRRASDLDPWAAWIALFTICLVCLWILNKRLRAREVVA